MNATINGNYLRAVKGKPNAVNGARFWSVLLYKKWQVLRGKCNTSGQEAAIRDFPESRWSPLPCGPRFQAPRGSSSLTGTHPSSPPTSSSSSAHRWRDGWLRQRCACVSVRVHQVRKKPPVPTRGALGVGSVSYRGRRTVTDRRRWRGSAWRNPEEKEK